MDWEQSWNKLVVTGGAGNASADHSEAFDLTNVDGQCDRIPLLPVQIYGAELGVMDDVPIICGVINDCYALKNGSWSLFTHLDQPRRYYGALVVDRFNGHEELWISGGESRPPYIYESTEVVTLEGVRQGPKLARPVLAHCMVEFKGQVFIIGGMSIGFPFNKETDEVYVYDDETDEFILHSRLNHPRLGLMCGVVKNAQGQEQIVVAGGSYKLNVIGSEVEFLSAGNSSWTIGSDLPVPLKGAASVQGDGTIFLVGGTSDSGNSAQIFEFDSQAERFVEHEISLTKARAEPAATLVPDNVVSCS
ncbi:hypothetical protein TCAL_06819 [Tigriopus californicus]|uniref:Uncharacterized protein n=1 Tax=Tigriopus californicus TaxID=6832 RepID=A0A553PLB9_TIGCA|nr:hypothetical protein TCAL_06819 [Tigriopus californicus]